MVKCMFSGMAGWFGLVKGWKKEFNYEQKCGLVYVKLRWMKDGALDAVVAGERDLRVTCFLISMISCNPLCCVPLYHLACHHGQLFLPHGL